MFNKRFYKLQKSSKAFAHPLVLILLLTALLIGVGGWFIYARRDSASQNKQSLGASTYSNFINRTPPLNVGPMESLTRVNVDFSRQLNSTEINNLLDWNEWYPMDFNVPENHRIIREWVDPEGRVTRGFSFNVHNDMAPHFWPVTYKNKPLDYVFFAECNDKVNCYPQENNWYKYFEITTVGDVYPTGTSKAVTLESWQRASLYNPEVYYDLEKIQALGGDCTTTFFKNDPRAAEILVQAPYKGPLVWTMPARSNSYVVNPPACAVYFEYSNNNLSFTPQRVKRAERFFVIGVNKAMSSNVLYAFNSYMKEGMSGRLRDYCRLHYQNDRFNCIQSNGVGSPRPYTVGNRTYYPADFEEYWMRKASKTGRWGNTIDSGGFFKFRWWQAYTPTTWPTDGHDAITVNYYVESCGRWGTSPKDCTRVMPSGVPITVYAQTHYLASQGQAAGNSNTLSQFNVEVNGKIYGHARASAAQLTAYTFRVPANTPINAINIVFINNGVDSNGYDRNLVVPKVVFKGKEYLATSPNTYTIGGWITPPTGGQGRCSTANDGANNYLRTSSLPCNGLFRFSD
jgi:hypothetical protein